MFQDLNNIFIKNSKTCQSTLRATILKHKLLEYRCLHCDLTYSYNGKKLKLQLDHIDGDNRNNELSNLRYLCPNCHSQTETYCRSKNNVGRSGRRQKPCDSCGKLIKLSSTLCRECHINNTGKTKIKSFTKEDLKLLLENYAMMEICSYFNTCFVSLEEVILAHDLRKTPYGDWTSRRSKTPIDYTLINEVKSKYTLT